MNYIKFFERIEMKYLISYEKYIRLRRCIDGKYMLPDEYGLTTICNIYYDTENYELIRASIGNHNYKEKLRLRCYGIPENNSSSFIEIKKKYNGIVYKRRTELKYCEAINYLNNNVCPESHEQIFNEIDYFMRHYRPVPKIFIAYDRIAMYGVENKDFRITFDFNIRSRDNDLSLLNGSDGKYLFDNNNVIMEIKTTQAMPIWITKLLSEMKIYPTSFSKYGTIYKNKIKENKLTYV